MSAKEKSKILSPNLLRAAQRPVKMGLAFKLCRDVLMKYYGRPEDLDAVYITMCVLNGLLALTAIMGNVLIIFALKKTSSIPSSTRILLLCLALTDLATGVLGHPLYIVVTLEFAKIMPVKTSMKFYWRFSFCPLS